GTSRRAVRTPAFRRVRPPRTVGGAAPANTSTTNLCQDKKGALRFEMLQHILGETVSCTRVGVEKTDAAVTIDGRTGVARLSTPEANATRHVYGLHIWMVRSGPRTGAVRAGVVDEHIAGAGLVEE